MNFEDTLASIDASLKSLLQIAMTGAFAKSEFAAIPGLVAPLAEAPAPKARAKKADAPATAVVEPDVSVAATAAEPAATRYFLIPKHSTVARVLPGEVVPTIESTVEVTAAEYEAKKAEYAKKSATAVPSTSPAAVSTPAATVLTASLPVASVSFKQVVDKLIELSKDTRPGKGRDAITAFVGKHGVAKVPALEALNKHAELLAEVEVLLAPDTALVEDDVFA